MSYPLSIVNHLAVADPALLAQPNLLELESCVLTKSLQLDLDKLFLDVADTLMQSFEMPADLLEAHNPHSRWKIISSLQKAIRFQLPVDAMDAAHASAMLDATATRKRLAVIAVEDVFMGNPLGTCIALAILGHPTWRKKHGELKVITWLAGYLAQSNTDRTALNLLVTAENNTTLPKSDLVRESTTDLIAAALDKNYTYPERQSIIYALAGTARYRHGSYPSECMTRSKANIPTLLDAMQAPLFMRYISEKTASRLGENMFHAVPLVHEMLSEKPEVTFETNPRFAERNGPLLYAAFDQYTREGKAAISKFFKKNEAMQPYVKAMPLELYDRYTFGGVFHAEGGVLHSRIVYGDMCQQITDACRGPSRFSELRELSETYIATLRSQIPDLNTYRSK